MIEELINLKNEIRDDPVPTIARDTRIIRVANQFLDSRDDNRYIDYQNYLSDVGAALSLIDRVLPNMFIEMTRVKDGFLQVLDADIISEEYNIEIQDAFEKPLLPAPALVVILLKGMIATLKDEA
jgi:hypothetical protein